MKTKDLINIGVFTVLYLVVMLVAMLPIPLMPVGILFLPLTVALIEGTVFQLFLQRVDKPGMLFLFTIIVPVVLTLTGRYWTTALFGVVSGLLAERHAARGQYKKRTYNRLSYLAFSIWPIGALLPIWALTPAEIAQGNHTLQALARFAPLWTLPLIFFGTLICAWYGEKIGHYMMTKHFRRYMRNDD